MRAWFIALAACTPVHAETTKCDGDAFDATAMKADVAYLASPELDDEERGEHGSEYFVGHTDLDHAVEYINLDMIGSYASRGWVAAMGAFAKLPARKLLDQIKHKGLDVIAGGRASRSDHEAFCE